MQLGDDVCVPVSLTDNQVSCRPPTNRPNKHVNDTFCHGDSLSLKASVIGVVGKRLQETV